MIWFFLCLQKIDKNPDITDLYYVGNIFHLYIIALKLPLCRIKSDFADKHGITTKAPIRASRPKLSSPLLRQKSVTRPVSSNDENSIKADDGTSLLSILRAKQSQRNSNKG